MKTILFILFIICSFSVQAQTGLGISLGNPTGFHAKHWLGDNQAVDGGIGRSFGKHSSFSVHSDFLWHNEGAFFFNEVHSLDLYYGVGGRMEFADDIEIGVRVPLGLAHKLEEGKADIFAEIAPIFDFVSKTGIELHWLFGARYYF